jgi:molybdopterin-guanine dinucleotide biosynthesis protein A
LRRVPDLVPDSGPLGGLDAALAAARHRQLVVVACDMPFVTASFFEFLLTLTADADAVVPRTEDGYHPLCAVYMRECRPVVARRLAAGKLSMRGLLEDVRVRVVEGATLAACGDCARLLANVNSPAALAAAVAGTDARSRHEI